MSKNKRVVTPTELVEVKKAVKDWASTLRSDLIVWAKSTYGFNSLTPLAYELGFKPRDTGWRSLSTGESIATDVRIYAVLFRRTGLSSVDPRSIPPKYVARRDGNFTLIPRAWSEEEWIAWNQQEDDVVGVGTESSADVTLQGLSTRLDLLEAHLASKKDGGQLNPEMLWDLLLAPIVERITREVRNELEVRTDSAIDPMLSAIETLLGLLRPVVEGSSAMRDMFARQYGPQAADLGSLLTALVHPNVGTREVMIGYRKEGV